MKSPGEISENILSNSEGGVLRYCWLDIADDIANISSSLRNHMHHIVYMTLPPHIVNKPWISCENEKGVKIMIKN